MRIYNRGSLGLAVVQASLEDTREPITKLSWILWAVPVEYPRLVK